MSPVRTLRYFFGLLWASFSKWLDDSCLRHGAALSYYMVLSLAPLLVILVGLVGLFDLLKYAVIVVSSLPLMLIYPFVQKYFVKGIMIGSVKG